MSTNYIIQYKCGCTDEAPRRKDLLNYCGTHGDDVRVIYPPVRKVKCLEQFQENRLMHSDNR